MSDSSIAFLVFNQTGKGTYWRAYYLGRELARRGQRVTLLCTAPSEQRRFSVRFAEHGRLALVEAPDLLRGSLRSGWDVWATLARTLWLYMGEFDLIHAFECRPTAILPALHHQFWRHTPLVIDWCDWFGNGGSIEERPASIRKTLLRPVETFFEQSFRTWADATTVISPFLGAKAQALGVPADTITLLPNGCDAADFPLDEPRAARAALGLPLNAPLIGYVGAIFPRDARLMAAAFDAVQAQRPDAKLLVLGYCNLAIEELVREPAAVIRTGSLSEPVLRQYLRACTLGWVPLSDTGANRGRWPLKLSTYMAAGIPFVTSAVGDLGAFARRYPAGIAAAPQPNALAAAALALIASPSGAEAMGALGRSLAEGELSWARVADGLERVYQHVLA